MKEKPADMDDRLLVAAYLRRRSESSFRTLYRKHNQTLYGMVARLLGGPTDADDVVQETWAIAAQKLPRFRWESELRTWLAAIAINCARNRLRRRRDHERADHGQVAEIPLTPAIEHKIDPIDMERAINALPDGYRHVLTLHDVHGYKHEEIATILGIATGTSKSQLTRARSSLRRWLTRSGENNDAKRSG